MTTTEIVKKENKLSTLEEQEKLSIQKILNNIDTQASNLFMNKKNIPSYIKATIKEIEFAFKTTSIIAQLKKDYPGAEEAHKAYNFIQSEAILGNVINKDYYLIAFTKDPVLSRTAEGWSNIIKNFAHPQYKPVNIKTGIIYIGEEYEIDNMKGLVNHKINYKLRTGILKDIEGIYAIATFENGHNAIYSMNKYELLTLIKTTRKQTEVMSKEDMDKELEANNFTKKTTYINWLEKMAFNKVLKGLGQSFLKLGYLDMSKALRDLFDRDENIITVDGEVNKDFYKNKVSDDEAEILQTIYDQEPELCRQVLEFYNFDSVLDVPERMYEEVKNCFKNGLPKELENDDKERSTQ